MSVTLAGSTPAACSDAGSLPAPAPNEAAAPVSNSRTLLVVRTIIGWIDRSSASVGRPLAVSTASTSAFVLLIATTVLSFGNCPPPSRNDAAWNAPMVKACTSGPAVNAAIAGAAGVSTSAAGAVSGAHAARLMPSAATIANADVRAARRMCFSRFARRLRLTAPRGQVRRAQVQDQVSRGPGHTSRACRSTTGMPLPSAARTGRAAQSRSSRHFTLTPK